jgi:geranylgeranylglycerol-phosphate geranylgeranyltransferase
MRRSWVADIAELVRAGNLLIAAAGVAIGGSLALGRVAFPQPLVLAMLSAMGLGALGNVANDLWDAEADRVNHPRRPLASGAIPPAAALVIGGVAGGAALVLARLAGPWVLGVAVVAAAAMLAYSPFLKPVPVLGNVVVAAVASLPLLYGAGAVGDWRVGLVPFGIAALLHLAREIVKDVEDVRGDRAAGRRTIPIAWGERTAFLAASLALVAFVPVAVLPWLVGAYGVRYGALASLVAAGAVAVVARLLDGRLEGARSGLKLGMILGLLALLWDRL